MRLTRIDGCICHFLDESRACPTLAPLSTSCLPLSTLDSYMQAKRTAKSTHHTEIEDRPLKNAKTLNNALLRAVQQNDVPTVDTLLTSGAHVNARDKVGSAPFAAGGGGGGRRRRPA